MYVSLIIITTTLISSTTSFNINHKIQTRTSLLSSNQPTTEEPTTTTTPLPLSTQQQQIHAQVDSIIRAKALTYFPDPTPIPELGKKNRPLIELPIEERFLTFTLDEHKPLGCTAEESLAMGEDGAKHVFVSKVTEGGNADRAGVLVGDVIVGVSGSFEDIVEVVGSGLDRVRSLVGGRQDEMNLILKIVRNTDVLAQHEKALVDICILPEGEGKDSNLGKCIEALYQSDYDIDDSDGAGSCLDTDTECMLDTMLDTWGEELDVMAGERAVEVVEDEVKKVKKPAPWSSRSSGSGTYVLDPKTRKMINLDDQ